MEIEGIIIMDLPLEEGVSARTGNPWKKKSWVLETLGQYPRKVKFDAFGDRAAAMTFEMGKTYSISVDVESREFNGRWYTDLRAFSSREIQPGATQTQAPQQQFGAPQAPYGAPQPSYTQAAPQGMPVSQEPLPSSDPSEDLPF